MVEFKYKYNLILFNLTNIVLILYYIVQRGIKMANFESSVMQKFFVFLQNIPNKFDTISELIYTFFDLFDISNEEIDEFFDYLQNPTDKQELDRLIEEHLTNDDPFLYSIFDYDELEPYQQESIDLMTRAAQVDDHEQEVELLKQAIQIWPENWDAYVSLIDGNYYEVIQQLRRLELRAREYEEKHYESFSFRYIRIKLTLTRELLANYLLEEALNHLLDLLHLEPLDFIWVRHAICAAYCLMYDWEGMMEYFDLYEPSWEEDIRMVLPALVLAIVMDKEENANDLFELLLSLNDSVGELVEGDTFPIPEIVAMRETGPHYSRGYEELLSRLADILPIIFASPYIFEWLKYHYQVFTSDNPSTHSTNSVLEGETSALDNVIVFPNQSQKKVKQENNNSNHSHIYDINLFNKLSSRAIEALLTEGLCFAKDFANLTASEVLKIKHVGPKTIEQLKANGVVFKEEE